MPKQTKHPEIYNLEVTETLQYFLTQKDGLSPDEAQARLDTYGPNAITTAKESIWKRLLEPFSNAFVIVLLFALALSLFEGEKLDATIIGVIVGVNAIIYYFQQYSVSRVLKTLKSQDISKVNVIRGGDTIAVSSEQLTYGDIVHIEEGMKVPADGRLIDSNQVQADEALLTGESLPIHKQAGALSGTKKVYDRHNMLFKGTYIKAGSGLMVVSGIGNDTELGGITTLAAGADSGRSPIERKIDDLIKKIIIAITIAAVAALLLALYRGIGLDEAARFSLVIVVSAVPEGLPVAMTIVLLLSARRMAAANALVKKTQAIETMGAITLIATDKTGTITRNILSVADKHTTHRNPNTFNEVIRASLNIEGDHAGDSLDQILVDSIDGVTMPASWQKVHEFPFNQQLRISGMLWKHGRGYSLYIKGAPEQILTHCGRHHRNDGKLIQALESFTSRGYRTIAFAHHDLKHPIDRLEAGALKDMNFDGFVGMADEVRTEVRAAVADARRAGIKVVMLTGDHVNTAGFIAGQVGIAQNASQIRDSSILANGTPDEIREALQETKVFGRVLPEHKYALLEATKGYEITAMTGDGVNDIPALVEADAGIAMGSGTDAAKDASDIVLLDNNFRSLVSAIRLGRTALSNIRKMVIYLLGTSGGEVMTMIMALVLGIPLPVAAIQILWINLVTDGVSVIPLGLSPPEDRQMKQPPRHPEAALLNVRQVTRVLVMAATMCVVVLTVFKLNLDKGQEYAQTLAFLSLIVIQWANAFNVNYEYKSWIYNFIRPNKKLWAAIGFSILLQLGVFLTPFGEYLHVVPVAWLDAIAAIVIPVIIMLIVVDLHKLVWHNINRKKYRIKT